ncbi:MAG TPA: hypothetical protein VJZ71_15850 [Phycisphaerae bacterium]|nr:hypothetical protein [Phycisphaerae bacterium]
MKGITKLPLSRLTTPHGEAKRVGDVGVDEIRDLLRAGPVRFVMADVGAPLRWVPEADCFVEWKREIQPHLAEPDQKVYLGQSQGGYAYFASQWDDGSRPVILLSKAH